MKLGMTWVHVPQNWFILLNKIIGKSHMSQDYFQTELDGSIIEQSKQSGQISSVLLFLLWNILLGSTTCPPSPWVPVYSDSPKTMCPLYCAHTASHLGQSLFVSIPCTNRSSALHDRYESIFMSPPRKTSLGNPSIILSHLQSIVSF